MRVIHVVRQFHPMVGGLEGMVANLAEALRDTQGIDSSIVTLNCDFRYRDQIWPAEGEYRGLPITRIPWRGSSRYPLAPGVLKHLKNADLVHVHAVDFFFDFVAHTQRFHRMPLVASTHGGFFHTGYASRLKKIWFASMTRASARHYGRIFASSQSDGETFSSIAPGRTIVIENGVDIRKWHDAGAKTLQPTLLFIGRFSLNKAIEDLFALVGELGPPWRLLVVGDDSDLTGDDLRAAAARLGVADRTEIHVGPDDATVRDLCARASYIASASRFEGFGISAVEGLSAGLTPVLNAIAPFERLVRLTDRGICVPMSQPKDAAEAIRTLHEEMGAEFDRHRSANIAASASYGWPKVARQFAAEYEGMLAGRAPGATHTTDADALAAPLPGEVG